MIVDMHVHLPPFRGPDTMDAFLAEVKAMLDFGHKVGIDRQVMLGLDYGAAANEVLRQVTEQFPDDIIPFIRGSCIDPESPAMIERCVREYGFRGIKLHHELPQFPLTGLMAGYPLFQKAAELGVPVLIHSWHQEEGLAGMASDLLGTGYFPVMIMEELGRRYPETTFIFAHAGGMWVKAFQAAQPYPNVHIDISGFDPERGIVETAVEILGAERVLFGSDAPGRSYVAQLAKVQYADIGEDEKRLILGENAAALLSLR